MSLTYRFAFATYILRYVVFLVFVLMERPFFCPSNSWAKSGNLTGTWDPCAENNRWLKLCCFVILYFKWLHFYLCNFSRVKNLQGWFVIGLGLVLFMQGSQGGLRTDIWQIVYMESWSASWMRLLRLVIVVNVSFSLLKTSLAWAREGEWCRREQKAPDLIQPYPGWGHSLTFAPT